MAILAILTHIGQVLGQTKWVGPGLEGDYCVGPALTFEPILGVLVPLKDPLKCQKVPADVVFHDFHTCVSKEVTPRSNTTLMFSSVL